MMSDEPKSPVSEPEVFDELFVSGGVTISEYSGSAGVEAPLLGTELPVLELPFAGASFAVGTLGDAPGEAVGDSDGITDELGVGEVSVTLLACDAEQ